MFQYPPSTRRLLICYLKIILKSQYPLPTDYTPLVAEDITYEDANVVRYVAGYVYRKVNAKIAKKPNKLHLEKCLKELLQEEGESDRFGGLVRSNGQGWSGACEGGDLHALLCHGGSC